MNAARAQSRIQSTQGAQVGQRLSYCYALVSLKRVARGNRTTVNKPRPNKWMSLLCWLLPNSRLKRSLLRMLGNDIGQRVSVGPTLVISCGRFTLTDDAVIGSFNVFRQVAEVNLDRRAVIGNFNQFTAAAEYQRFSPLVGKLILGDLAVITNRHYFDCSGQIILKPRSGVGGIRSIFQSHEIDLADDETTVGRIVLGPNAMTGTGCTLLKDAYLPEKSVLAARSLLTRAREEMPTSTLYAGVPAKPVREIDDFTWWRRESYYTAVKAFDDQKFELE